MQEKLVKILNEMAEYLSIAQMKKLQEVLLENLDESHEEKTKISNTEYLQLYLDAKKIEGCSERTLQYYRVTIEKLLLRVASPIRKITTEEIRSVDDMTQEEYRKAAIDAVRQLSQDVGIPADLKDIVKPEDIPFLAQSAYDDACRPGNPKETSVEDITKLYESLI